MIINLKVKTLDSQTHEFSIDNEITIRQFKDKIAEKTNIAAEQQRIIYCGRVLSDDKQVKEYDVDGKVVHVAERPPPSARITSNSSNASGTRNTTRNENRGMRNSPLFRALDGMVVGAMAIPMNAGVQNQQTAINPLTSSSSPFCMNRITVARHMLDCANNIAAYLEDPERGLNNTSLDILTQGRWTMESTVVEVGITDIQQNQTHNIVEALQGAVSAALRQNGNANVTVVQLPTVFNPNGPEQETSDADVQSPNSGAGDSSASVEPMDETTSENNTNAEAEENAPGLESTEPSTLTDESGPATSTPNANQSPSRQRTGTRVLAEVIQQMRTVEARLNPFIDQYYELLQNEPTFEENDTTGRENTQRLFDRVSEAFHYLSHAQHAISDLMLDVSRPTPRYLCCRPILVEQSGYVSSNNYTTYNPSGNGSITMPNAGASMNRQQAASARILTPPATTSTPAAAASTSSATDNTPDNGNSVNGGDSTSTPPPTPASIGPTGGQSTNVSSPIQGLSANHQLQVARLIQAVVNSAPIDADFHVQINAPSILSIGVPMNANMRAQATQASLTAPNSTQTSTTQQSTETVTTATATPASNTTTASDSNTNTNSAGLNQARVDTTTHPTTATQTRSTARPQVQVANIPSAWNTRVIPANMVSSFDRFLPCNSHHIREPEARENSTNNNNNTTNQQFAPPRVQTRILRRVRRPNSTSAAVNLDSSVNSFVRGRSPSPSVRSSSNSRAASEDSTDGQINETSNYSRHCLRNQLLSFIASTMFDGSPVSEGGMSAAVERAISYLNEILIFLPQYDMHEYNSRASVEKLIRTSLPLIVNLINDSSDITYFETRLGTEFKLLFERLFVILFVCVGQMNAELYWAQIRQMVMQAIRKRFKDEALTFLTIQIRERTHDSVDALLIDDIKPFLVLREDSTTNPTSTTTSNNEITPMDTDSCSASGSASSSSNFDTSSAPPSEPDEVLPPVIVGSEAWHRNFPTTWLPIITRDIQRQTRQATQPAFSDAYISGMSAKRRKLIQSTKPAHDVKSLVAESVRRAIQTTGLQVPSSSSFNNSSDEISNAIATDSSVQASFCETLRSGVKERLKTDTDFNTDKFPNASKYFN